MSNSDHNNIYKNNPVLLKSYVNKRCSVTTTDKCVHTGIVYTVDPVSESVVLIDETAGSDPRLKFVIGHSVKKIDVLSPEVDNPPRCFNNRFHEFPRASSWNEKKR